MKTPPGQFIIPELQALYDFLQQQLLTNTAPNHRSLADRIALTPTQAASLIQERWRLSRIEKKFSNSAYEMYADHLSTHPDHLNITQYLAKSMYGMTVADYAAKAHLPISNPFIKADHSYHRVDEMNDEIAIKVIEHLHQQSFSAFTYTHQENYFPFIINESLPIEIILQNYLTAYNKDIYLLKPEHSELGLLKIKKSHPDAELIATQLQATGVIASPWALAIYAAKHQLNLKFKKYPHKNLIKRLTAHYPTTLAALKASDLLTQLQAIATDQQCPTHLLAGAMQAIIVNLPPATMVSEMVTRIALFLALAVRCYAKNYEKFSLMVYSVIHEVSLFFHELMQQHIPIVDYRDFNQEILQNVFPAFDLLLPTAESAYGFLAAPAMSGVQAFQIAIMLAKKMNRGVAGEPSIYSSEANYFEFKYNYPHHPKTSDVAADIYLYSVGPTLQEYKLYPGIDINALIAAKVALTTPQQPSIFILDMTTACIADLKLNATTKRLVASGYVSILIHESRQKFGLLHSDQAQYGRMYGLWGKHCFNENDITALNQAAERDLSKQLDMIIGTYLSVYCAPNLEKIKRRHFENNDLFKTLLEHFNIAKDHAKTHPYMTQDPKKLLFTTFTQSSTHHSTIKCLKDMFKSRESFGHFHHNISHINATTRFTASATDLIDSLVEYCRFYFKNNHCIQQLLLFLSQIIESYLQRQLRYHLTAEILLTALLMNISRHTTSHLRTYEFVMLYGLQLVTTKPSSQMRGRQCYPALMRQYHELLNQSYCNKLGAFNLWYVRHFIKTNASLDGALQFHNALKEYEQYLEDSNYDAYAEKSLQLTTKLILLAKGYPNFFNDLENVIANPIFCKMLVNVSLIELSPRDAIASIEPDQLLAMSHWTNDHREILVKMFTPETLHALNKISQSYAPSVPNRLCDNVFMHFNAITSHPDQPNSPVAKIHSL